MGTIRAIAHLDKGAGRTYQFNGDFKHIVESVPPTKMAPKKPVVKQPNRLSVPTGFFTVLDHHDGENFNLTPYVIEGNSYYLYADEAVFAPSRFAKVERTLDPKALQLTLKFKVKNEFVESFKYERDHGLPIALVVDDVLLQVLPSPFIIDTNNCIVVKIRVKDKNQADKITQSLQRQINKPITK